MEGRKEELWLLLRGSNKEMFFFNILQILQFPLLPSSIVFLAKSFRFVGKGEKEFYPALGFREWERGNALWRIQRHLK